MRQGIIDQSNVTRDVLQRVFGFIDEQQWLAILRELLPAGQPAIRELP